MTVSSDSASNPFGSPSGTPDEDRRSSPSCWIALALLAFSAVVFVVFGWMTFVIAAFVSIVPPDLDRQERTTEIIDKLFFRQSGVTGVVLFAFAWLTATGLVAMPSFLCTAIVRVPSLWMSFFIACFAGTILAIAAIALLVTLG